MTAITYQLHGLRIRSALPIAAPTVPAAPPDVEVVRGRRRAVPREVPAGRLLALRALPAGAWSAAMDGTGYTIRAYGLCDFELDLALRRVTVHLAADASAKLAPVLLGSALSTLLTLRGHCVLHASAVQMHEGVVAFIGASGSGKTTTAALCCAAGARLVSDDMLRVECVGASAWCFSGSRELRLRSSAAELGEMLSAAGEYTADGRLAVRPPAGDDGRLPLVAVVAPICAPGATGLEMERRFGQHAVMELIRHPHTTGWVDSQAAGRDFPVLAALATTVPVYRAWVPSGPPFSATSGEQLLEVLRSERAVCRDRIDGGPVAV